MIPTIIISTIALGLVVDQHGGPWGQVAVDVVVWMIFIGLLRYLPPRNRLAISLCVVYATLGEIFLSLVWGIYSYRLGNIPLFVPPGHALLFMLGISLAPRLTDRMVWAVPVLAAPFVLWLAAIDADTFGVLLYAMFVLCLIYGPAKKLYATMFLLALAMEIYGTWLGNWTWSPRVPWFGLATINPPLAAGAFYCVLDFLVTVTLGRRQPTGGPAVAELAAIRVRQR